MGRVMVWQKEGEDGFDIEFVHTVGLESTLIKAESL